MIGKIEKNKLSGEIKLIALDLDYTTLTRAGLTRRTKETLEEAVRRGYQVVIATGRPIVAVPDYVLEIEGLKYVLCSNGAHIVEISTGNFMYSEYIDKAVSEMLLEYLKGTEHPIEVFTEGKAYVSKALYDDLKANGSDFLSAKYILRTREAVDDIWEFWRLNCAVIENVNIHFREKEDRAEMRKRLSELNGFTLTSSTKSNLEIGGEKTSKANALKALADITGIGIERVMAFGDSPNDIEMISAAGFGVAMANGEDEVKAAADYVTLSNEEEGVAYAIRKLLFNEEIERVEPAKSPFKRLREIFRKKENNEEE